MTQLINADLHCHSIVSDGTLTPEELAALGADTGDLPIPSGLPIPIPDVADQTIDLTLRVAKDTTRLAGLTLAIGGGATGDVSRPTRNPPPASTTPSAVPRRPPLLEPGGEVGGRQRPFGVDHPHRHLPGMTLPA